MERSKIYEEMEQMLGLVPSMFKSIPDASLELEWGLFKKVQLEGASLDGKQRELIGLGISAVTKCRYCVYFHSVMAKLNGASDEEIQETIHYAKATAGWSAYINGMALDYNEFTKEMDAICKHVREASK
ncbi:carboxymuconolactone decarboxylase family protein [Ancylomarina sp.]|uniref:carboxymuconolactone decarboxylase family protein n=1 Tax=Ancylomarina sp. TaxID=1970196 RepID=UPI0035655AC5